MTPLDIAHAATEADPASEAARLRFYQTLADTELFLLLDQEPEGDTLRPTIYDLSDGPVTLAFDTEERLADFTQGPAAYAALPGRIIAAQLTGQGIGLGLNLGAASATLLPPDAMEWLSMMLDGSPQETTATPRAFHAPGALPAALLTALTDKLSRAGGLARTALLAGVEYGDGRRGHMLGFVDASPAAQTALARAVAEALAFSGLAAGELDVTFLAGEDPACAALARVARAFDLPRPEPRAPHTPSAPGTDPDRPPRLR